tara:strand:- start:9718 stop:9975 length:258 start_codon:yes stop_codon:yes gene_type:complete
LFTFGYLYTQKQIKMKVTRIEKGIYKVKDVTGTWIAKKVFASDSNKSYWCAWDCENENETSCENSWGVTFSTFKLLKRHSTLYTA